MEYIVFLEQGVYVTLPEDIDPDSPEGYEILKQASQAKLLELVQSGNISISYEEIDR